MKFPLGDEKRRLSLTYVFQWNVSIIQLLATIIRYISRPPSWILNHRKDLSSSQLQADKLRQGSDWLSVGDVPTSWTNHCGQEGGFMTGLV